MPCRQLCSSVVALALVVGASHSAQARAKRFYFEISKITEPAGTKPSLKTKARTIFSKELAKHPEVVTSLGDPPPARSDIPKLLAARQIQGYRLVLRITKAKHSMNPPPPGKKFKVLMVEVGVAIDAEQIPSRKMALAGEGSAMVGTETRRYTDKERVQLTHEALVEAVAQAMKKSITKLATSGSSKRPSRGKRRRHRPRR